MALLNSGTQIVGSPSQKYKDHKANILFGGGNSQYSSKDIQDFFKANPNLSNKQIEGAALSYGVSRNQLAEAMKDNPTFNTNMDKYIDENISKELIEQPVPVAAMPSKVKPKSITVGKNETVEGRMEGLLKDPNNPLNVQAQTFAAQQTNKRGLLNSSINTSAAQDAMMKNAMPIAQQDAATFYDANKTNVGNDLSSQMFNSDQESRIGMFNAGVAKDYGLTQMTNQSQFDIAKMNRDFDREIARMDSDNKLAIANIQAMANDSGIAGDLGKSLMSMYQQTAADPNISSDAKTSIYNNLKSQYESIVSLLQSIKLKSQSLNFPAASGSSGTGDSANTGTNTDQKINTSATSSENNRTQTIEKALNKISSLGLPADMNGLYYAQRYEELTGVKVDPRLVVPQSIVNSLNGIANPGETNGIYNYPNVAALSNRISIGKSLGLIDPSRDIKNKPLTKEESAMLGSIIQQIHPPGTMRADNPMFYVWNQDVLANAKL